MCLPIFLTYPLPGGHVDIEHVEVPVQQLVYRGPRPRVAPLVDLGEGTSAPRHTATRATFLVGLTMQNANTITVPGRPLSAHLARSRAV